jgi:hypothetical protein
MSESLLSLECHIKRIALEMARSQMSAKTFSDDHSAHWHHVGIYRLFLLDIDAAITDNQLSLSPGLSAEITKFVFPQERQRKGFVGSQQPASRQYLPTSESNQA